MKYFIFDTNGALQDSYDSRTGSAAYVTTTPPSGSTSPGSNVTVIPKAILPLATFWTDTSPMPTSYRQMDFPVIQYGTSHAATMAAESGMNSAGYVSGLNGAINGSTTGVCYFQVYKNGTPMGIIASGQSNSGKITVRATGTSSNSFTAGDVLSVWIKGDQSNTNQSFSATIEVTFTA